MTPVDVWMPGTRVKHCANDRLPAERLEQTVTRRLWQVLNDGDMIDHAITRHTSV
jgi:hypothetical protein